MHRGFTRVEWIQWGMRENILGGQADRILEGDHDRSRCLENALA